MSYLTFDGSLHCKEIEERRDGIVISDIGIKEDSSIVVPSLVENVYKYIDLGYYESTESEPNYLEVKNGAYFDTGILLSANCEYWLEFELEYLQLKDDLNQIMGFSASAGCGIGVKGFDAWIDNEGESDLNFKLSAGIPYFHKWYLNTKTFETYSDIAGVINHKYKGDNDEFKNSITAAITGQQTTLKLFAASDASNGNINATYNCRLHNNVWIKRRDLSTGAITITKYNVKELNDSSGWVNKTQLNVRLGKYAKYLKIFHHNVNSDSTYFSNEDEAKECYLGNRFSRLGQLSSDKFKSKVDNRYEFLLTYPQKLTLYGRDTEHIASKNTGIIIDWSKSFYLDLTIRVLKKSLNQPRLIIGNYPANSNSYLSIELLGSNQLAVYTASGSAFSDESRPLGVGQWNIQIMYTVGVSQCKLCVTAKSITDMHVLQMKLDSSTGATSDSAALMIGVEDYRNGETPFQLISAACHPTNIWKQSANPLGYYAENTGKVELDGYADISINMNTFWGQGAELGYNCKGLGANIGDPKASFLDTMPGDIWWWGGLGQYETYNGGFPACDGNIYKNVELWVRIDNTYYDAYCSMLQNAIYLNKLTEGDL